MKTESRRRVESGPGPAQIALYHVMFTDEGFDRTAEMLFTIVREAARAYPGRPRALFLDIEGLRPSPQAGYDHDAFEIMSSFVLGFLSPWLTEINTPLISARMTKPQKRHPRSHCGGRRGLRQRRVSGADGVARSQFEMLRERVSPRGRDADRTG